MNKICSICETKIVGYDCNPHPFKGDVCCEACNQTIVMPVRLYQGYQSPKYALLFKANETIQTVRPKKEFFKLEDLQETLGGNVEVYITTFMSSVLVYKSNGKMKRLPKNKLFEKLSDKELPGEVLMIPVGMLNRDED
ncbi:MAG: hypothetical protein FWE36_00245 [Erysipelotrichales bacterium]|nr:hypothetical protein [Erysipelotrichales bacterium]